MTASHKLSLCCIFACDTSTFLIYQTFRRQDGGIATPLSPRLRKPFQNRTIPRKSLTPLPCLLLPLHRILPPSQPLQKDNNPSPRTTTLASLVKGRWIDGKPQTVALLHFCLRYIHLFDLSNFSPSRRRDCHTTIPSLAQTLPKPHYPSKIANTLAS